MGCYKFTKFTKLEVTFEKKIFFLMAQLSLLYQQKIFMKANTKLCSTQYSALRKISKFKCTLNKDKKIFKVSITSTGVNHIQVQSRFKCDDLVNQVSI